MKFIPAPPQKLFIRHLLTHDTAYGNVGMGIGKTAAVLCAISALLEEQESIDTLALGSATLKARALLSEANDPHQATASAEHG